jgi:hypothetical protein
LENELQIADCGLRIANCGWWMAISPLRCNAALDAQYSTGSGSWKGNMISSWQARYLSKSIQLPLTLLLYSLVHHDNGQVKRGLAFEPFAVVRTITAACTLPLVELVTDEPLETEDELPVRERDRWPLTPSMCTAEDLLAAMEAALADRQDPDRWIGSGLCKITIRRKAKQKNQRSMSEAAEKPGNSFICQCCTMEGRTSKVSAHWDLLCQTVHHVAISLTQQGIQVTRVACRFSGVNGGGGKHKNNESNKQKRRRSGCS